MSEQGVKIAPDLQWRDGHVLVLRYRPLVFSVYYHIYTVEVLLRYRNVNSMPARLEST